MADTDTLDLAQDIFIISQDVQETPIDKSEENVNTSESPKATETATFNTESYVRGYSEQKNIDDKLVISETINNNFYVMTVDSVKINDKNEGYIIVSEIANDILVAVDERKKFYIKNSFFGSTCYFYFFSFFK